MKTIYLLGKTLALAVLILPLSASVTEAQPTAKNQRVFDHWTPARMKAAIPRQLVIASNGEAYLRRPDGSLQPYGHNKLVEVSKVSQQPRAKPGTGGGDNEGPDIAPIEPDGTTIVGASQRFAAKIIDATGVRSASLVITYPSGSTQSISLSNSSGDVWENKLSGFTDGIWGWHVEAKDTTQGKGNTSESDIIYFTVDTSGGGGGGGGGGTGNVVTNSGWPHGGAIQASVGRIYFEMPTNARLKRWAGYVCSGTVANDGTSGRSVIITAAHCVYDDAYKAFARNVLFIPNQNDTTGSGTDSNCGNDPEGCWTPSFGVVDINWTTTTFPDNIPWDYAYYVVNDDDTGAHSGSGAGGSLEVRVGGLPVDFTAPFVDVGSNNASDDDFTHGIGYSYSDDPFLMYCAESMTTEEAANWWLPSCGLSGGSSGGPWVQPMDEATGDGIIISVNSWGYNGSPGMAGPKLVNTSTSAECLFNDAKATTFGAVSGNDGEQGIVVSCP